jgi:hypothetical protein
MRRRAMAKMWRVSIDTTGLEEAETEEQAVRQFLENLEPSDCFAECENGDDEDDEEVEELGAPR